MGIGDVLQPTHLIFILVVALLVLGPKRLPEVGKSLGKGIRDFRGALSGIDEPNPSDSLQQTQPAPPQQAAPVTAATTVVPDQAAAVVTPVVADSEAGPTSVTEAVEVHDELTAAVEASPAPPDAPVEQHPVASSAEQSADR